MTEPNMSVWAERVEAIEAGYEFMLAYAAQGREQDDPASEVRQFLNGMHTALEDLAAVAEQTAQEKGVTGVDAFLETLADDARKAHAAITLVLSQPAVSSQLIDNLNASIHIRALLTDLFLIDEALR